MYRTTLCLCTVMVVAAIGAAAEEPQLAPFPIDWRADAASPVDLSGLLDAPAGKDGFVRIAEGHLARPDGKRLRIWGVNVSAAAAVPSPQSARLVAARLARLGINGVRFHFFDRPVPRGIIDNTRNDTRAIDPEQLDRLDRFIAELKKRGIYTNLNLNVARGYKAGDGVADHELLGFAKALTYFDPRLIELQKEYARLLLTHRNPYTGNEYRHEPAVAIVELVNENSLVEAWVNNRLVGKNTTKYPGTWTDIPASYEKTLTQKYQAWLKQRLSAEELAELRKAAGISPGEPIPRMRRENLADAPQKRLFTEATFYMEIERQYFQDMDRYLKQELGVKSLLVGSSDHSHYRSGYPHLASISLLDVVDGHVYWQHPRYTRDPKTGKTIGFWIGNSPMVDDPLHSTVVQLSRSAVAGKPYTVSEVNHLRGQRFEAGESGRGNSHPVLCRHAWRPGRPADRVVRTASADGRRPCGQCGYAARLGAPHAGGLGTQRGVHRTGARQRAAPQSGCGEWRCGSAVGRQRPPAGIGDLRQAIRRRLGFPVGNPPTTWYVVSVAR